MEDITPFNVPNLGPGEEGDRRIEVLFSLNELQILCESILSCDN